MYYDMAPKRPTKKHQPKLAVMQKNLEELSRELDHLKSVL